MEEKEPIHYKSFNEFFIPLSHGAQPISYSSSKIKKLGYIDTNIVGIQSYSGSINGGETVHLVQKSLNSGDLDPKAIEVFNMRMVKIGEIEEDVADVLAPWMDKTWIIVIGIVPKERDFGDMMISCRLHIFAEEELFPSLEALILLSTKVKFRHDNDVSFLFSEDMVVVEQEKKKSYDEISQLEPPKEVIKSELFLHQKQALLWLARRENNSDWTRHWHKENGHYVHKLFRYKTEAQSGPLRGGIFADDMGLGKTLTMISLIAFDKYPSRLPCGTGNLNNKLNENGDKGNGICVLGDKESKKSMKKRKIADQEDSCGGKRTLIVCPPSVLSTWTTELEKHTMPNSFKVHKYHGPDRTKNVEELKKYDIVLTTYATLATESSISNSTIKEINWWRIILDEGHMIKNPTALQTQAVCELTANRRWVVTATPIQNNLSDLYSFMVFLRYEPFSEKNSWQIYVHLQLVHRKTTARLQILMAEISLRRTRKETQIQLPQKTVENHFVDLSEDERRVYNLIEILTKTLLKHYVDAGSPVCNYTTVLSATLRLRQVCTHRALCNLDANNLLPTIRLEDLRTNPRLQNDILKILEYGEDLDCPICLSVATNLVITHCDHIFCHDCIFETLKVNAKAPCPLCRRPLTINKLSSVRKTSSDADNEESSSTLIMSSKVSALLELLRKSREQNSATKSVVFSQFRKMLILLEKPLKESGFKVLHLNGSMDVNKRAQMIEEFGVSEEGGPTVVLLASLKASGTGINLTAASRVYFLEPWWNLAVEEQAMNRVHRIGQKEEVKIVRLIAKNTIEEGLLKLQKEKRRLEDEAFLRGDSDDESELGVSHIINLLYR